MKGTRNPEMANHERETALVETQGRVARLLAIAAALLCGVVWAAAGVRTFSTPLGQDQSWLLYAARAVLHGVTLYGPELVETNPPFAVWFHAPAVLLGRLLHVGILDGFRCFWLAIAAATGCWSAMLFKRLYRPTALGLWMFVAIVSVVGLFAVNGEDLGQREHLVAMLLLPYLLAAAFRMQREKLPQWELCAIGVVAAVAVCLKPQHVLDVVLVEVLVLVRLKSWREWVDWSWISLGVGVVMYVGAVKLFAPTYLSQMVPLLKDTYWGFDERWPVVWYSSQVPVVVVGVGALIYGFWRRRLRFEALDAALLAAAVGARIAYFQQHKGWHYQLICFVYFGCLLLALCVADGLEQWIGDRRVRYARWADRVEPLLLGFVAMAVSLPYFMTHRHYGGYAEQPKGVLSEVFKAYPSGTPVVFLSVNMWEFPAVLEQDKVLGSRYVHLWILPAIVRSISAPGYDVRVYLAPERVAALSTLLRANEAADLARWKPTVVVVDRCTLHQFCDDGRGTGEGRMMEWFEADPAFQVQWLAYEFEKTVDGLDVYTRRR